MSLSKNKCWYSNNCYNFKSVLFHFLKPFLISFLQSYFLIYVPKMLMTFAFNISVLNWTQVCQLHWKTPFTAVKSFTALAPEKGEWDERHLIDFSRNIQSPLALIAGKGILTSTTRPEMCVPLCGVATLSILTFNNEFECYTQPKRQLAYRHSAYWHSTRWVWLRPSA